MCGKLQRGEQRVKKMLIIKSCGEFRELQQLTESCRKLLNVTEKLLTIGERN
jgi:hypothetical protein